MDMDEKQRLREEDLQRLRGLRLMDDDFLGVVFDGNIEATELLLNIILGRKDMVVTQVVGQREIKNPNGRSVRLDIHAVDSESKQYDVEVQREDRGAGAQRARFNSSMLDTRMLKPGEKFSGLAEGYVIFITENDVLGKDISLYHIDRVIKETNELFGDGSHIIYVNGAYKNDEDSVGKLMHDFRCIDADDMNYSVLADRVRYFKESKGGIETMCRVMEEMRDKAVSENNKMCVKEMLKDGLPIEKIARYLHITVKEVEEYAKEVAVAV
ncbi:MAG: PD-(D/E)XK nuclease family transposase [Lachnospiraceae bacterium]|nr:PD-(D/E)XK nuclease family transposase [Lachnospiraceae bacterium]